jgi:hypothetical protein
VLCCAAPGHGILGWSCAISRGLGSCWQTPPLWRRPLLIYPPPPLSVGLTHAPHISCCAAATLVGRRFVSASEDRGP